MNIALKNGITLRKEQVDDLVRMCNDSHFANFSEMGAGKTLPSALLSKGVIEDNICDHAIIVTPKIVLGDWLDVYKLQIDCDYRNLVTLYHAPGNIRPFIKLRPILIMTYETLCSDIGRFMKLALEKRVMITFDEAHKLRNHDSMRTIQCTELSRLCKRVYLLTGSPLTNGLKNAYSYINILRPNQYYRDYEHFKRRHMRFAKNNRRILIGYHDTDFVSNILNSFSVRHLKREMHDLPPVTFVSRILDWDPVQRKLYKQFVQDSILELEDKFIEGKGGGPMLIRCHQIITNPQQLDIPCDSTRFKVLEDDLESIDLEIHKVVIYAHYRHTIKRLREQLKKYNPAVIFGGVSDVEKEKDKFKYDPSCKIMLAHPQSAGVGTNFTVASYVIFFEYSYDLDNYDQAVSRLDRPGQKWPVTVLNYMVRGSMEQTKIIPMLVNKKTLSMDILKDPKELIRFISLEEEDFDEVANF